MVRKYVSSLLNRSLSYLPLMTYMKYLHVFETEADACSFITENDLFDTYDSEVDSMLFKEFSERIQRLGSEGQTLLLKGNLTFYDKMVMVLFSLVQTDYLFLDFLYEVIQGCKGTGILYRQQVTDYFCRKKQSHKNLQKWGEATFKTLGCKYISILTEGRFIKKESKTEYQLQLGALSASVCEYISKQNEGLEFLRVMNADLE